MTHLILAEENRSRLAQHIAINGAVMPDKLRFQVFRDLREGRLVVVSAARF